MNKISCFTSNVIAHDLFKRNIICLRNTNLFDKLRCYIVVLARVSLKQCCLISRS